MADINALMSRYLAAGTVGTPSPVVDKQASVANAAATKQAALGGMPSANDLYTLSANANGTAGIPSASQLELDLRALTPIQLRDKYGPELGNQLIAGGAAAANQTSTDASRTRSGAQTAGDTAVGVWSGLTNSLAGIGVLGAGIVNKDLGVAAAQTAQDNSAAMQAVQTEALAGRRRLNTAENFLDTRDSTAQYETEKKTDGDVVASLRRIGRDVSNTIENVAHQPMVVSDGLAQGVGSLLAAGPVSKGLAVLGKAATPAAIGLMEGGGAYQQTAAEIAGMSFEQLARTSPEFNGLVAQGMHPEDARTQVASNAGLQAAAVQAPLAAAAGTLVSKFEGAPLKVPSLGSAAGNLLRETVEEGIQSGTGQLAQNQAIQQHADNTKALSEGVGEQVGLGALYGLGSAGVVQAPGAAARVAVAGAKGAVDLAAAGVNAAVSPLVARGEAAQAANEQASPVANSKVAEQAATVVPAAQAAAPAMQEAVAKSTLSEEDKQKASQYVDDVTASFGVTGEQVVQSPELDPALHPYVAPAKNAVEVLQRLALIAKSEGKVPDALRLNAASMLSTYLNQFLDLTREQPDTLKALGQDHPVNQQVGELASLAQSVEASPAIQQALRTLKTLAETANDKGLLQPVTAETAATPEGQRNAQAIIATAETAPQHANPVLVDTVLAHAAALQLSPAQVASLKAVSSLLAQAKADAAERERLGLKPMDVVTGNVLTDKEGAGLKQSALEHAKGIREAYRAGNLNLARERLADLMKFAQHMQNKVGALNTAFGSGQSGRDHGVGYDALDPQTREWYRVPDGPQGIGITPSQANSVGFAQRLGVEANTVAQIANGLAEAYPELKIPHVQPVSLDPALTTGPAHEVVKALSQRPQSATLDAAAPAGARAKPVDQKPATPAPESKAPAAEPTTATPKGTQEAKAAATPEKQPVTTPAAQETPAVTPKVSEEAAPKPAAPEAKAEPERKGLAAVFPQLLGAVSRTADGLKNYFLTSFKLPAKERSRTGTGRDDTLPIAAIQAALASEDAFRSFLGSDGELFHNFDAELADAYDTYLSGATEVAAILRTNLEAFLNKGENRAKLLAGEANRWINGKVLSLVESDADGNLAYNERLLQNAVLAGMQWMLQANESAQRLDDKDIAAILHIAQDEVTQDHRDNLDHGMGQIEAQQALATKITQFWGLRVDKAAPDGYAKGIPLALAGEVLRALQEMKLLHTQSLVFDEARQYQKTYVDESAGKQPKGWTTVNRLTLALNQGDGQTYETLQQFPQAIEQAVMIEPEETRWFGQPPKMVAERQMNNPLVENTRQQKDMIRRNQATPYYAHLPMVQFYEALGRDNVLALFGEGSLDDRPLNTTHRKTLDGRNRSILSAYDALTGLMAELRNRADAAGVAADQLSIHYAFNVSRVGRLQMLGKFSPQASKLMREAILPTRSTLDLSQGKQRELFYLGLAQALGEKVHKQPRQVSLDKVQALLDGPLAPAVELLRTWHGNAMQDALGQEQVATLKAALGSKLSPVAVMGLMEYSRFLNAEASERKAFTTPLYVEADGVTNGPITAMALMTLGRFTPQWLGNIAKGGMFLDGTRTVNQFMGREGAVDLYQTATTELQQTLTALEDTLKAQTEDKAPLIQFRAMRRLMHQFLPGLEIQADGTLKLDRGLAKNPLTITIYGSGPRGIAAKVVAAITDEIYARMSQGMERYQPGMTEAEAMFPGLSTEAAEEQLTLFRAAINVLTAGVAVYNSDDQVWYVSEDPEHRTFGSVDPEKFAFNAQQLGALVENVQQLYVGPLRSAINTTIGSTLGESTKMLQQATQVQSIFLQHAFAEAVQTRLAEKAKEPGFKKGDFLSQEEQQAIMDSLMPLAPLVQTPGQTFFIAGSQSTELADTESFGAALNDRFKTPAFVYAPQDAGVAGIPYLNIGTGDALMIQLLSRMKGVENFLPVFDGINFPLDQVEAYSEKANQAVYQTWQGNPLQAVLDSYSAFLPHALSMPLSPALQNVLTDTLHIDRKALRAALKLAEKGDKEAVVRLIQQSLRSLEATLALGAKQIDIRHAVLDQVQMTVDQMASAESPYVHAGVSLAGLTPEDTVKALNQIYDQVEKDGVPAKPAKAEKVPALAPEAPAPLVQPEAVVRKTLKAHFTNDQIKVLLANGVRFVLGDTGSDLGQYHSGSNTVMLGQKATPETWAHEAIHAATFTTVQQYYAGQAIDAQAKDAIQRIEQLMAAFMELDATTMDPVIGEAIAHAQDMVEGTTDQAVALNEFMAYALTNDAIVAQLKTEPVPLLARLTQKVVTLIKRLVFGARAPVGKVGQDIFSNLRFNTMIVAQAQPTAQQQLSATVLAQTAAYGDSQRLTELNQAFDNLIGRYTGNTTTVAGLERDAKAQQAMATATETVNRAIAHGFPMTVQAQTTMHMIVAALATEAHLDANALSRMEDLYRHVTKTLTVEDLMDPQAADPQAERYHAQQQYDTLMGNFGGPLDASGRSGLLPTFLGLAMVHDGLRAVLAKLPLPKSAPKSWDSLDNVLANGGMLAMEALSRRMSGEGKQSQLQGAFDALTQRLLDTAQERQSALEQAMGKVGSVTDRANEILVTRLADAAESVIDKANAIQANSNSKVVKAVAEAAKLTAAIVSEEKAGQVAEGIMSAMNRLKLWAPLHDIIGDLVGRTLSNAGIYDLIKLVKSHISQDRQQYREHLPTVIAGKFSRTLSESEWTHLFQGLGQTDLASLYDTRNASEVRKLLTEPKVLKQEILHLETALKNQDGRHWAKVQAKAQQLATYMMTGEVGHNLLRNAYTVANLFGEVPGRQTDVAYQQQVDQLVTLYALQQVSDGAKQTLSLLAQQEAEGVDFALAYLTGQRADELVKSTKSQRALINQYKGHLPSEPSSGVSLIVAPDSEYASLAAKSFVRVGNYLGSAAEDGQPKKGYYFAPVSGRAPYNQGILQNVRQTANGVDLNTGYTVSKMTAGRITKKAEVARISKDYWADKAGVGEKLLPVYNEAGKVVAYERSVAPAQLARLEGDTHLAKMIGVWRGRQVEEAKAQHFNEVLVDSLHAMYQDDLTRGKAAEYVDLFGQLEDPVLADAVALITPDTRAHILAVFGEDGFMVRKDLLNDAMGYRNATIGDAWTGNSRWSQGMQDKVRTAAMGIFGNEAYRKFLTVEKTLQNYVADARVLIVVKSVVVPMTNLIGNIYQLAGRGVPLVHIFRGLPKKTAEIDSYVKSRLRQVEAEAELRAAAGHPVLERKLQAEIKSIGDAHRRLSIWPLIEAGEFSAISDAGISRDEILLSEGRLHAYMESLANKLPGPLQTAGRYALVTKDTALFQGLQKAVEYGDFLAKAILYDDLTRRQGRTQEQALARVTEEFVNYDRLPGRFRGYLESTGLLWFYNFKIRAAKVALSMVRNNPVHALLAGLAPTPTWFGQVGTPLGDNFFTQLGEGGLAHSIGLGQAFHAPMMNPWVNLVH